MFIKTKLIYVIQLYAYKNQLIGLVIIDDNKSNKLQYDIRLNIYFSILPKYRKIGIGTLLLNYIYNIISTKKYFFSQDIKKIFFYSYGNHLGAIKLAQKFHLKVNRKLYLMQFDINAMTNKKLITNLDNLQKLYLNKFYKGYCKKKKHISFFKNNQIFYIRNFKLNQDEHQWIMINKKIFSWHPEQRNVNFKKLKEIMKNNWFNTKNIFLITKLMNTLDKTDNFIKTNKGFEELLGFNWINIYHDNDYKYRKHSTLKIDKKAEIYIFGIVKKIRHLGLARLLFLVGLQNIIKKNISNIFLYVEYSNYLGIKFYKNLGFIKKHIDAIYLSKILSK